jgi:ferric-chelate reductase
MQFKMKDLQFLFLVLVLVLSAALSLGLTYAPCYASLCSESFLPSETRLHIASFYALLASSGSFLLLRARSPWVHQLSAYSPRSREMPVLKKRITAGGTFIGLWLVGITLATTGFWLDTEQNYWALRTDGLSWTQAKIRLAVTGVIGHHADILLGLTIIPVSRNSVLGRTFRLHQSTLLYAHKILGYLLVVAAFAHGATYYVSTNISSPCFRALSMQTFVAEYAKAPGESKEQFNIDNPTLTMAEAEAKGGWYFATLPSGMFAFLLMLVMVVTALPFMRRHSYNTFYYTHIICSIVVYIALAVHASTDFYFLLPGLSLWLIDWAWRWFRGDGGLSKQLDAVLENASNGWYRITLPVSERNMEQMSAREDEEKHTSAFGSPIRSFYINFPSVSRLQSHAFTAAKSATSTSGAVFLFQRAVGKKPGKLEKEWTWRVADLVREPGERVELPVRVEGPYIPADSGFRTAAHVVCIVGGTGLTGAYSLALWWLENRTQDPRARFRLIWTVRQEETCRVREWAELEERTSSLSNFNLRLHISSTAGRLSPDITLQECLGGLEDRGKSDTGIAPKVWVYVSGPEGLLSAAETACLNRRQATRKARCRTAREREDLSWYVARWEV